MLGQRFVSVLGIAVIGTAVAVGGCASAADQPPVAGGVSAPAAGGNVRVTDYSDNDGPKSTVIFVGVVGDYGQATSVHPDGSVDPEHDSQLDVALTQGTFRIGIAELHQKITGGFLGFPANRSTCSGTVTATAAMPIVAGSGTGAYRGIKGSFAVTATIDEVDAKANCSGSSALLSQTIVMTVPERFRWAGEPLVDYVQPVASGRGGLNVPLSPGALGPRVIPALTVWTPRAFLRAPTITRMQPSTEGARIGTVRS